MRRSFALNVISTFVALTFVAGCGTSGDNDEADKKSTTTTFKAGEATSTTENKDSTEKQATTTSTEPSGQTANVTTEQLKAILPTLEDLNDPAYTEEEVELGSDESDDPEDGEDEEDDPFAKACPGVSELEFFDDTDGDTNKDSVSVSFSAPDDREVEVRADPTPIGLSSDELENAIKVLNACGEVTIEDEFFGSMKIKFEAERDNSFGDHGLRLTMATSFTVMGETLPLEFVGYAFHTEGVGVFVSVSSGFDSSEASAIENPTPVPADAHHLEPLSALMVERIANL